MSAAWPWLVISCGAVLAAGGYVIFMLPMRMVEGGVRGTNITFIISLWKNDVYWRFKIF